MPEAHPDVVLIGGGIMSATLGVLLRHLEPDWNIHAFERLEQVAAESSEAWNNAGTGHSAFCELNYTPETKDGVDVSKALKIAGQFERSKELWASLVEREVLGPPTRFIQQVPHMSFVTGEADCRFLEQRYQALIQHPLFEGMQLSRDARQLQEWMPLMMEGRAPGQSLAATRMDVGTDVNFGALTRAMFAWLQARGGFELHCSHEIRDIDPEPDGQWHIQVKDLKNGQRRWLTAPFVFIGAGGGSLRLLERSDIPEAAGYGGFPVSGQWLICQNPGLIRRHAAKVYGKAANGAPPMSVPHLDTRLIGGEQALLFGPYAGFSTRFLKQGSLLDLPASLTPDNLGPMVAAGLHNLSLTRYLLDQVTQSDEERLDALREFVPTARLEDWRLEAAGQRVQIIKKDPVQGGVLQFGTEVVTNQEGTIAALLGASPGASTSVSIMLDVLERCFSARMQTERWRDVLQQLLPSYREGASVQQTRARSAELLQLEDNAP